MKSNVRPTWPTLKSYSGEHLRRIALPLGGIGTGTISLGGRGNLIDWEMMNTPAKGYTPTLPGLKNLGSFFAISTLQGTTRKTKCLEGPIDSSEYEASEGCKTPNSGFPRFSKAKFHTAYPLGVVELKDESIPLEVEIRGMNPLIPGDSAASSLPCTMLTFHLKNPTNTPVEASICGTFLNPIGSDGRQKKRAWGSRVEYLGWDDNRNEELECKEGSRLHLISDTEEPEKVEAESYGDICITATGGQAAGIRTAWAQMSWSDSILDFWDEFSTTGEITARQGERIYKLLSSVARKITLAPGEEGEIKMLLSWRFPNRMNWKSETIIGNHYSKRFASSIESSDYVLKHWNSLTSRTLDFVSSMCNSDIPEEVIEAALFNVSTLRTQTCFQTPDGKFYGWEGVHDEVGSCEGTCTHVWNYEQTTAYLFADLSRSMREVEFLHATNEEGKMRFRNQLPLSRNKEDGGMAAADGQMGCIMKVYRDWKLSDDKFLIKLWPKVKAGLSFAWVKGGWDADKDGVMEGCQHNTMDVDYYGPNPQMQGWYLGALKAGAEMAEYLTETSQIDEAEFARTCRELFERGSAWTDENLFNGEYYEQQVQVSEEIHPDTTNNGGIGEDGEPILQLGKGCLIDQLVGQYMAHVCGLGYILNSDNVKKTLSSILKYDLKRGFHDHFNHLRNYVFADEIAVVMATYPLGERPKEPFPYYNEVMTGFEHQLAAHLMYEGMIDEGVELVGHIRHRYDGKKRSPYNEAECGHHYARAMAAWAEILALSRFRYDRTTETLTISEQSSPMVFCHGEGWGTWYTEQRDGKTCAIIEPREGKLPVKRVLIGGEEVIFLKEE